MVELLPTDRLYNESNRELYLWLISVYNSSLAANKLIISQSLHDILIFIKKSPHFLSNEKNLQKISQKSFKIFSMIITWLKSNNKYDENPSSFLIAPAPTISPGNTTNYNDIDDYSPQVRRSSSLLIEKNNPPQNFPKQKNGLNFSKIIPPHTQPNPQTTHPNGSLALPKPYTPPIDLDGLQVLVERTISMLQSPNTHIQTTQKPSPFYIPPPHSIQSSILLTLLTQHFVDQSDSTKKREIQPVPRESIIPSIKLYTNDSLSLHNSHINPYLSSVSVLFDKKYIDRLENGMYIAITPLGLFVSILCVCRDGMTVGGNGVGLSIANILRSVMDLEGQCMRIDVNFVRNFVDYPEIQDDVPGWGYNGVENVINDAKNLIKKCLDDVEEEKRLNAGNVVKSGVNNDSRGGNRGIQVSTINDDLGREVDHFTKSEGNFDGKNKKNEIGPNSSEKKSQNSSINASLPPYRAPTMVVDLLDDDDDDEILLLDEKNKEQNKEQNKGKNNDNSKTTYFDRFKGISGTTKRKKLSLDSDSDDLSLKKGKQSLESSEEDLLLPPAQNNKSNFTQNSRNNSLLKKTNTNSSNLKNPIKTVKNNSLKRFPSNKALTIQDHFNIRPLDSSETSSLDSNSPPLIPIQSNILEDEEINEKIFGERNNQKNGDFLRDYDGDNNFLFGKSNICFGKNDHFSALSRRHSSYSPHSESKSQFVGPINTATLGESLHAKRLKEKKRLEIEIEKQKESKQKKTKNKHKKNSVQIGDHISSHSNLTTESDSSSSQPTNLPDFDLSRLRSRRPQRFQTFGEQNQNEKSSEKSSEKNSEKSSEKNKPPVLFTLETLPLGKKPRPNAIQPTFEYINNGMDIVSLQSGGVVNNVINCDAENNENFINFGPNGQNGRNLAQNDHSVDSFLSPSQSRGILPPNDLFDDLPPLETGFDDGDTTIDVGIVDDMGVSGVVGVCGMDIGGDNNVDVNINNNNNNNNNNNDNNMNVIDNVDPINTIINIINDPNTIHNVYETNAINTVDFTNINIDTNGTNRVDLNDTSAYQSVCGPLDGQIGMYHFNQINGTNLINSDQTIWANNMTEMSQSIDPIHNIQGCNMITDHIHENNQFNQFNNNQMFSSQPIVGINNLTNNNNPLNNNNSSNTQVPAPVFINPMTQVNGMVNNNQTFQVPSVVYNPMNIVYFGGANVVGYQPNYGYQPQSMSGTNYIIHNPIAQSQQMNEINHLVNNQSVSTQLINQSHNWVNNQSIQVYNTINDKFCSQSSDFKHVYYQGNDTGYGHVVNTHALNGDGESITFGGDNCGKERAEKKTNDVNCGQKLIDIAFDEDDEALFSDDSLESFDLAANNQKGNEQNNEQNSNFQETGFDKENCHIAGLEDSSMLPLVQMYDFHRGNLDSSYIDEVDNLNTMWDDDEEQKCEKSENKTDDENDVFGNDPLNLLINEHNSLLLPLNGASDCYHPLNSDVDLSQSSNPFIQSESEEEFISPQVSQSEIDNFFGKKNNVQIRIKNEVGNSNNNNNFCPKSSSPNSPRISKSPPLEIPSESLQITPKSCPTIDSNCPNHLPEPLTTITTITTNNPQNVDPQNNKPVPISDRGEITTESSKTLTLDTNQIESSKDDDIDSSGAEYQQGFVRKMFSSLQFPPSQALNDPPPGFLYYNPDMFDILLVVDNRERFRQKNDKNDKNENSSIFLADALTKAGLNCLRAPLAIGDFAWVMQPKDGWIIQKDLKMIFIGDDNNEQNNNVENVENVENMVSKIQSTQTSPFSPSNPIQQIHIESYPTRKQPLRGFLNSNNPKTNANSITQNSEKNQKVKKERFFLDFIIERKTMSDLDSSIRSDRHRDQRRRLKQSGIRNVIYLFEEFNCNANYEYYSSHHFSPTFLKSPNTQTTQHSPSPISPTITHSPQFQTSSTPAAMATLGVEYGFMKLFSYNLEETVKLIILIDNFVKNYYLSIYNFLRNPYGLNINGNTYSFARRRPLLSQFSAITTITIGHNTAISFPFYSLSIFSNKTAHEFIKIAQNHLSEMVNEHKSSVTSQVPVQVLGDDDRVREGMNDENGGEIKFLQKNVQQNLQQNSQNLSRSNTHLTTLTLPQCDPNSYQFIYLFSAYQAQIATYKALKRALLLQPEIPIFKQKTPNNNSPKTFFQNNPFALSLSDLPLEIAGSGESYGDFTSRMAKHAERTPLAIFKLTLRQIKGVGQEAINIVAERYKCIASLYFKYHTILSFVDDINPGGFGDFGGNFGHFDKNNRKNGGKNKDLAHIDSYLIDKTVISSYINDDTKFQPTPSKKPRAGVIGGDQFSVSNSSSASRENDKSDKNDKKKFENNSNQIPLSHRPFRGRNRIIHPPSLIKKRLKMPSTDDESIEWGLDRYMDDNNEINNFNSNSTLQNNTPHAQNSKRSTQKNTASFASELYGSTATHFLSDLFDPNPLTLSCTYLHETGTMLTPLNSPNSSTLPKTGARTRNLNHCNHDNDIFAGIFRKYGNKFRELVLNLYPRIPQEQFIQRYEVAKAYLTKYGVGRIASEKIFHFVMADYLDF